MSILSLKGGPPQVFHQSGGGGGGGGGGNWINAIAGGASATLMSHAKAGDIKKQNAFYKNLYSPGNINSLAQQFNPWIWDAINGKQGSTGFTQDLYNILQGKDISPYLLNRPLNQLNQGSQQNLAQFQSLVGRNNSGGGLANAYALANLGGRNNAVADLMNRYGQWREQQRRTDINWGMGQVANSQNMGFQSATAYGNKWQVKPSWLDHLANSAAGGTAAYTGSAQQPASYQMSPPQQQPFQYSAPGNTAGQNAYVGSLGSQGSWYGYPSGNTGAGQQNYINSLGSSGSWYNPSGGSSSIQTGSSPNWYSASNYWQ